MRCPGQDTQYWKPGDIFEVDCPKCGNKVEFFKDEATRRCRSCGEKVLNPKMDLGCAGHCRYAGDCVGRSLPLVGGAGVNEDKAKHH
jgi:ribosomal protein S27E